MSKRKIKLHRIKREWEFPIFVHFKKHFCPCCQGPLEKAKVEAVADPNSPEANGYALSNGDTFFMGNTKFIRMGFCCSQRGKTYCIQELKSHCSPKT